MMALLLGVPGKLKTLLDRISSARAAKLDNIDAAISTRAAASTAVSNADLTPARAGYLDALEHGNGGVRPASMPCGNIVASSTETLTVLTVPGAAYVSSGALTAGTLATMLSVTGKGALTYLGIQSMDATSRTHRVRITIDGTVVFDATSAPHTTANGVGYVHGHYNDASKQKIEGTPLLYDSSLLVEYASSLTETNKTRLAYTYYTRA